MCLSPFAPKDPPPPPPVQLWRRGWHLSLRPLHPFRIECLIKFHERSFAALPPSKLWGGGGGGAFVLAARFSLFNLRKETRAPPSLLQLPLFAFCDMIPPSSPFFLRRRHKSGRQNLVSSPFLRSELGSWLLPPWPWRQGQPRKNGITAWETRQVSTLKRTPLIPDLPRLFNETGNASLLQAESSQIGKCPPFCCRSPLIPQFSFLVSPLRTKVEHYS